MASAQQDSPQVQQHSTAHGLIADCLSCYQPVAAPTGLGVSPCLGVRLPRPVFDAIHTAARLQGTTAAALARAALCTCFAGIVDDLAIGLELQRRIAALGRGGEVKP